MDFTTIAEKLHLVCTSDVYLAFYKTFRGCKISDFNLIGFCDAFSVDINLLK